MKRLTIENFESIKGKETKDLKIFDAEYDKVNDLYVFNFQIKGYGSSDAGEVIIKRTPSQQYSERSAYYLEIRWISRNNAIYSENVYWDVFKYKDKLFERLNEIVMERIK